MQIRKLTSLLVAFVFAAGLVSAADNDYKIDRALMTRLADGDDTTAAFFVVFGERPDLAQAYRMTYTDRGRFVIRALKSVANRSQVGVRVLLRSRSVQFTPFWIENKIYVPQGDLELARALAAVPEVVGIIPERIHRLPEPQPAAAAGTQGLEWNISKIGADKAWGTTKGQGIVVANIDTGVQYTHPAVAAQYRGNLGGGTYQHNGNFYDPTSTCTGGAPCDNNGHGTHTMGTMVGNDGGSNQIGVAPGAKWMACKGCASNSCADSSLTSCAEWITDPLNDDGSMRPDVVNNSWGGGGGDAWYQSYVQNWVAAGIFPAFSIGNTGPKCSTAGSPGDYPQSFSSGATDSNDVIAYFSSRGPSGLDSTLVKPEVSAPGYNIRSSYPTNTYALMSGTSMASPHSAGVVALIWAAAPKYKGNIGGTEQVLKDTTTKLTTTQTCGGVSGSAIPNNTYGFGRIDAFAAVQEAISGAPANHPPTVTITSPNNGAAFACGVAVTFAATATDPDAGDTVSPITWTDNSVSMGTGSTATRTFACTATGNHNISAAAQDNHGASDSDTITVTITNGTKPSAPSNLSATVSGSVVTLKWKDNSNNESGFKIERAPRFTSSWAVVKTVGANVTTTTDAPGRSTWNYRVRATNVSGDSDPSNVVLVNVKR